VVVNKEFWAGKRVFITGHTGFKGSWLSLWLQHMGATVTGYALRPPTFPAMFEVADVGKGMISIIGDIRDGDAVRVAMKSAAPEIVIHMAAQPLVRYSYVAPTETYSTNVMGTVNVLEAARFVSGIRGIVNVTSDKCYDNREWVWGYRENEAMGGYDPYSSSKGCAELVTAAYRSSFFNKQNFHSQSVALASARAGNVIGGGDWAEDRLVPDILSAMSKGEPVCIRSPQAVRPWQHVLEPLSGYLSLAEKLYENGDEFAEAWNFGPNDVDAKPVQWIVEQLSELWGEGATWKVDSGQHPHEAHYLKLDCSKAYNRLHWRPKWNLSQTLAKIIAWQRAYLKKKDMRAKSIEQINEFCS
jgi:CDP-glucose 4,6-dehydratase